MVYKIWKTQTFIVEDLWSHSGYSNASHQRAHKRFETHWRLNPYTSQQVACQVVSCNPCLRYTKLGSIPMDEWSAHCRDLNLTRHNIHRTDMHLPSGIRTHNTSKQTAADPHIRPCGYWGQPFWHLVDIKYISGLSFRAPLHNSSKCLSVVYKVWIWRMKDGLGVRIYNVW